MHDNNRSELNELNKLYSLCKKTLFLKKTFFSNKKQLFFEMIGLSRFDYFTDYRHETRKKLSLTLVSNISINLEISYYGFLFLF